jgi:hypothetical protein
MRPRPAGWLLATSTVAWLVLGLVAPGSAVAEGSLSVDPTSGPPGATVTVAGSGFTPSYYPSGLPIQINLDHGNGNWDLLTTAATVQPDASGNILAHIQIPTSAPAGLLAISAFTGSGASPSASFTSTGSGGGSGPGAPPAFVCGGEPCANPRPDTAQQGQASPAQIAEATKIAWEIAEGANWVCEAAACNAVPADMSEVISFIGHALTIGNLASASIQEYQLGQDIAAFNRSTQGHVSGAPYSPETIERGKKVKEDLRQLHQTLVDSVPGLSAVFPAPADN